MDSARPADAGSRTPTRPRPLLWALALLPACLAVFATRIVERSTAEAWREQERAAVVGQLSALRARIEKTLEANISLAQGLRAQIAVQDGIEPEQFQELARELLAEPAEIRHIALLRGTEIIDTFPREGNAPAIGTDLARVPSQRPSVLEAQRTGRTVVVGPVELVQGGTAVIARIPIYHVEAGAGPRYWGQLSAAIDIPRLLRAVQFSNGRPLRTYLRALRPAEGAPSALGGDPAVLTQDPVRVDVAFPSGAWELAAVPSDGWDTSSPERNVVRGGGAAATLLLGVLGVGALSTLQARRRALREQQDLNRDLENRSAELRRARDESRGYQEQLLRIVDSLPALVAYVDEQLRYVWVNRFYEHYLRRPRAEIIGRPVRDFYVGREDEYGVLEPYGLKGLAGESSTFEFRTRVEGREVVLAVNVVPDRSVDGKVRGFIVLSFDRTEQLAAEDERRLLQAKVQQAQRLESLGVLAGGIAHDFNNLLQPIMGLLELALTDLPEGESELRPMLAQAQQAAHRAAQLSRQMLDFSGQGTLAMAPIDLNRTVDEVAHLVTAAIPGTARVEWALTPGLPPVIADAGQLVQVAMNLVINAGEALEGQPGTVRIVTGIRALEDDELEDRWTQERRPAGPYVFLEVEDDGRGMDEATLARIFDPFFTTKFTGRGLGLAATLGIVRGHRGLVDVRSQPGQGTRFRVYFPAASAGAEAAAPDDPGRDGTWVGAGLVLLADDEPLVADAGRRMLERLGFSVLPVSDGTRAVDLFCSRPGDFAAVVLDLMMPGLDGLEAFRRISACAPDVPVLIASGFSEAEVRERFAGRTPAGFLKKPFRLEDLRERLRRVVVS